MQFEWDEVKYQANLAKRGIDFLPMRQLFDGRPIYTVLSRRGEEDRCLSTSVIEGRFYTVVWTWRGEVIRLISARRSRDGEQGAYRALHGGPD